MKKSKSQSGPCRAQYRILVGPARIGPHRTKPSRQNQFPPGQCHGISWQDFSRAQYESGSIRSGSEKNVRAYILGLAGPSSLDFSSLMPM